jgi:hypothetical protein
VSPALRRHRTTIALSVLTAAAGVALYVERGAVTTSETRERKKNLLPAFRGDDVTEVQVTQGSRTARVFRGAPTGAGQRPWQIEIDGATGPAEEMAVDQLLGSLRDGVAERKRLGEVGAEDRRAFGLDAPRGEIAVAMGRQRYRVRFGGPATTPPGAVWAEVEGHWVAVITAQLAAALEVGPDALRRRALVTGEASDLDALTLEGAGGPRRLVRAPWRVPRGLGFRFDGSTPEGKVRASAAALDRVWEALGRMKADAFLGPAEAEKAATKTVTVTLVPHAAAHPVILEVGGDCPGHPDDVIAVRREEGAPTVAACVPHAVLEALSLPASDLVDRRLVGARADEVIDVRLQQGPTTISIARSGAQWHEQQPADRPIDPEVGRAFLDRLLDVQATAVSERGDGGAFGLDPPRATVRVASLLGEGGDDRVELVEVGAERDGVVHVRRVEDGTFASVPASAAAALFPDELTLRDRKVLDLHAADVRSLRVSGPLGAQRFERSESGAWSLLEPHGEGLSADAGLLSELADAVTSLSAERWVGAALPEHGLDRPRLTIAATMASGKATRTVEVSLGAPAASGYFGRTVGDATVFVAPHRLEEAANRWMLDRAALLVDIERSTRVTLAGSGGKKLVLEQTAGALHVVSGASADPTSAAMAAAVRSALGDLVADGAVTIGAPLPAQGFDNPALVVTVAQGGRRVELRFGAGDSFHGSAVYYARREGIGATFAVARSRVQPLLDAVR